MSELEITNLEMRLEELMKEMQMYSSTSKVSEPHPTSLPKQEIKKQNWLVRVSDGQHFISSSKMKTWSLKSGTPDGKCFLRYAKEGDFLWFVRTGSEGQIIAVATFVDMKERETGPLFSLTLTNEELGWTKTEGNWDREVHYKELYDLRDYNLYSKIKGQSSYRRYNENCAIDLSTEYIYIQRYLKTVEQM